ncbi:N-acetylneuraminate synthase family protein [Aquaspirillum serpens]|uniref:N-acetylneuraminate synthase family protein n=1 Tax=Aquaspirillum serpens TaxID=190 RepID=UPI0003B318BD|nr:N-acetylneuraminate synthase family protein [Aquaspirillum serpens]
MTNLRKFLDNQEDIYFIAEVGSNHSGSLDVACEYIKQCAQAGASAVKFQSWKSEKLNNIYDFEKDTPSYSKALPVLKQYEIPQEWYPVLAQKCNEYKIDFISTPFDKDSADLIHKSGVCAIKIASSDINYYDLLEKISTFKVPVILSTGMANLEEINKAIQKIGFDREDLILLHCVAAYPPVTEDANLLAINTLKKEFNKIIGFSDHFTDQIKSISAVSLGATVIEKHVTFSREQGTPDAPFAILIEEMKELIKVLRLVKSSLGSGEKLCMPSEKNGLTFGRRGLFAASDLKKGTVLKKEHISVVRPNITDLSAADLESVIGHVLQSDLKEGFPLTKKIICL